MNPRFAILTLFFVVACGDRLTRQEAATVLDELTISAQASALTGSSVEISTNFTIGDAAEAAADELRTFVESQLACAEVSLTGATLTVDYGANPGNCTYRGQTYAGTHSIEVVRPTAGDVLIRHTWTDFRNQTVTVTGTAEVTWSVAGGLSRRIVSDSTWTRLSDGRQGIGTADMSQTTLSGGLLEGFESDGVNTWLGEAGDWTLNTNEVEMRWVDAVPQSGRYALATPFGIDVTVSFERVASTTIQVTIDGGDASFSFDVITLPDV